MGIPRRETPLTDDESEEWTERKDEQRIVPPGSDWPPGQYIQVSRVEESRAADPSQPSAAPSPLAGWAEREADRRFMKAPPGGWTHADRIATHPSDRWATPGWQETRLEVRPRVKEVRLRRLMTQKQLSDKSGVSVSAISRVESGVTDRMRIESWRALAEALGVSVEDLMDLVEVPLTEDELRAEEERIARRKQKEAERHRLRRERLREERRRAGAKNGASPRPESPGRPSPGDRTAEG